MALIVVFQNDGSGPDHAANYAVEVYVNRRVIDRARVTGHNRADDWRGLVRALVAQSPAAGRDVVAPIPDVAPRAGELTEDEHRG